MFWKYDKILTGSHSENTVPVATKGVGNGSPCYVTKVPY